jgi:transposase-like protein
MAKQETKETLVISELARKHGLNTRTLRARLKSGWPIEKALNDAVHKPKLITYRGTAKTISGWAMELGINSNTLYTRLKKYPVEVVFSEIPNQVCDLPTTCEEAPIRKKIIDIGATFEVKIHSNRRKYKATCITRCANGPLLIAKISNTDILESFTRFQLWEHGLDIVSK